MYRAPKVKRQRKEVERWMGKGDCSPPSSEIGGRETPGVECPARNRSSGSFSSRLGLAHVGVASLGDIGDGESESDEVETVSAAHTSEATTRLLTSFYRSDE